MNNELNYRAGFVGLIGFPNSGKSTLMNELVKEKVAIVSPKPQTTRRRVHGIVTKKEGQIIFVDAPGLVKPKGDLNKFLATEFEDVILSSDAIIIVIAVDTDKKEWVDEILKYAGKKPWFAVVTKVDLEGKSHRISIIKDKVKELGGKCLEFSSVEKENSENTEILREALELLPESPKPLYDEDFFTPHSTRELVAEIIREKCFLYLEQEIPYSIAIRIQKFEEKNDLDKIFAQIIVSKENHISIVVGKKAEKIKEIGTEARKDIETLTGKKAFLDLKVVVRESWSSNRRIMQELGYVVEKDSHHRSS